VLRCSLEKILSGKYVMSIELILKQLISCNISSPLEQAHFLAQCEHESANFKHLSESSNYRYKSAKLVFARYKAQIEAKQQEEHAADDGFCPQPWLFDLVYGTRMGNQLDGTSDHDGFNFRGGGLLQLTGKDNYAKFLEFANTHGYSLTLGETTEFTRSDEGAILSAIWYWQINQIGQFALLDDVVSVSKLINCGSIHKPDSSVIGLAERISATAKYKQLLGLSITKTANS
jgi:putative chitinase